MYCGDCGNEVEAMDKLRIRHKGKNVFRCPRCASKITQLSTEFDGWPTPEFSALDDESKKKFFNNIRDITSRKDVVAQFHEYMKGFEEHSEWYEEGGEFLPLTVWAARGFDTERIQQFSHPWDIREHYVLGSTYRLPIYSAGKSGKKGKRREDVEENSGKRQKVDGASESEESSSSSSSSRSRRKKKGKKNKKGKKDNKERNARKARKAKEREQEEKKKAKEREKECAKNLKDASAMSDKVKLMKTTLQDIVREPTFQGMPQRVRDTIEEDYKKISEIYSDVKKVMDGDHNGVIRHLAANKDCKSVLADMKRKADTATQLMRQASLFN